MGKSTASSDIEVGSPWLDDVAHRFAEAPELPWMLAAAAVIQTYKVLAGKTETLLSKHDLSMSRYEILGFLDRAPEGTMSAKDLKRATFLHPPTMTYTLDWLEERGLVKRRPSTTDRRSVAVVITAKGRKLFTEASSSLSEIHFGMAGVDREDAIAVARVLARSQPT